MLNRRELRQDTGKPPNRERQRVATRQNDFPNLRSTPNVVDRRLEYLSLQGLTVAPHHLASEAKTAIYGAGMCNLQEHTVRVTMHNSFDRTEWDISDGISPFVRKRVQLPFVRQKLASQRIVRGTPA
jgi:hypothetical protein